MRGESWSGALVYTILFEYGVYHGMVSVESALADALLH